MSLSKMDKLVRLAHIEGNITMAKLIRTIQLSRIEGVIVYTDGALIYVGDEFWERPVREQYFITAHEFLHIILKHTERAKGKNHKIYNLAADIVINEVLRKRGRQVPSDAVTYDKLNVPKNLISTEDVYNYLMRSGEDYSDFTEDMIQPLSDEGDKDDIRKLVQSLAAKERSSSFFKEGEAEGIVSVPQCFKQKTNWFDDLMVEIGRLAIRSTVRNYHRPSRVRLEGCILKGGYIHQYIPRINVIIDVSGSMGEAPLQIAGKIDEMKQYLKIFKPEYYWLNTTYGKINDIKNIPLGGGTDLSNVTKIGGADLNVVLTDCEDECGIDVINNSKERFFIITDNQNSKIKNKDTTRLIKINNF